MLSIDNFYKKEDEDDVLKNLHVELSWSTVKLANSSQIFKLWHLAKDD